jgi:hypothetical protein
VQSALPAAPVPYALRVLVPCVLRVGMTAALARTQWGSRSLGLWLRLLLSWMGMMVAAGQRRVGR